VSSTTTLTDSGVRGGRPPRFSGLRLERVPLGHTAGVRHENVHLTTPSLERSGSAPPRRSGDIGDYVDDFDNSSCSGMRKKPLSSAPPSLHARAHHDISHHPAPKLLLRHREPTSPARPATRAIFPLEAEVHGLLLPLAVGFRAVEPVLGRGGLNSIPSSVSSRARAFVRTLVDYGVTSPARTSCSRVRRFAPMKKCSAQTPRDVFFKRDLPRVMRGLRYERSSFFRYSVRSSSGRL